MIAEREQELEAVEILEPMRGWYYVRLLPAEEETAGGIAIPESAQVNFTEGVVLHPGPEPHCDECARPDDRVMFARWLFSSYTRDGKEGFINHADLLAVRRGRMAYDHGWGGSFIYGPIRPVNDWVMILPDPSKRVEVTSKGVAVAHYGLVGDSVREKELALTIYREMEEALAKARAAGMPPSDRVKVRDDVFDRHFRKMRERHTLDENAVWSELKRLVGRGSGQKDWEAILTTRAEKKRSGRVLEMGAAARRYLGRTVRKRQHVYWDASETFESMDPSLHCTVVFVRARELCAVRQQ